MQYHLTIGVNLWCDIQRNTGKKWLQRNIRRTGGATGTDSSVTAYISDKIFVLPYFYHGLLVVHRRNPWAGQDLRITLRFQQINNTVKIGIVK